VRAFDSGVFLLEWFEQEDFNAARAFKRAGCCSLAGFMHILRVMLESCAKWARATAQKHVKEGYNCFLERFPYFRPRARSVPVWGYPLEDHLRFLNFCLFRSQIRQVFEILDQDDSESLELSELREVVLTFDSCLTRPELNLMFRDNIPKHIKCCREAAEQPVVATKLNFSFPIFFDIMNVRELCPEIFIYRPPAAPSRTDTRRLIPSSGC
jgi:hypothetical protein